MNWFYMHDGKQVGPVSEAEFQALVTQGTVRGETQVWRSGMGSWMRYDQVTATEAPSGEAPGSCSQCGRVLPTQDLMRYGELWVCPSCKPTFLQQLKEGAPVASRMVYGGFWIRFAARFLDGIILGVANIMIMTALAIPVIANPQDDSAAAVVGLLLANLLSFSLGIAYETFFIGKYKATPGKMACGLQVVMADGDRVSYGRAFGRYLGVTLSSMTLMIGYIMAAFDDQKRALHDRICATRVVKK